MDIKKEYICYSKFSFSCKESSKYSNYNEETFCFDQRIYRKHGPAYINSDLSYRWYESWNLETRYRYEGPSQITIINSYFTRGNHDRFVDVYLKEEEYWNE